MYANGGIVRAAASRQYGLHPVVPASRFHFVVVFFALVQTDRAVAGDVADPTSTLPPAEGERLPSTGTPTFTPTIPALALSVTVSRQAAISVKTEAAFP